MRPYLSKTGSTSYFRCPVPDDLLGHIRTDRDNARTEWKLSPDTNDREEVTGLLRPHVTMTDKSIDDAREALQLWSCPRAWCRI